MQCFYNTIIGNVTDTDTETVAVERYEVHIMRTSGILLPVASLPSKYGIGAFSKEAYKFVDTLEKAGQSYWQILPLGPTGYGDSPYQSFSTFAGNPYFIDLEKLIKKGWITKDECKAYDFGDNTGYVDYEKIYNCRYEILRKAYERSQIADDADFQKFCKENKEWLDDYALYTEIKAANDGKSWSEWEDEYRLRDELALEKFAKENREGILFQKFMQYEFATQWGALKAYANEKGIEIIGDIPIYVAFDSADSWSHPELFQFDENGLPTGVAGCPPDAFSATGQLWGNPLYKWEYHKKTGYAWWMKRIRHCVELYDVIRIDHFRGFDEYYSIPYGDQTAEFGHWEKGPGMDIFRTVKETLGDVKIIAEELQKEGAVPEEVLAAKIQSLRREVEQKKAAGQLTKAEMHRMERILCKLEEYRKAPEFESVKATFDSEEEQREQMADKTLETLNHCFEFLESAFGESQEMAVFVTELNSNVYSIAFLRENDCAMYYKYNKGLLLDERREEILEQMDAVENVVERGLVED